jgi:heme A synthase
MSLSGVRKFAWATLIYMVFVIVWGAFVRATGSGAGCGDHWPLCNGQVIPRAPTAATLIEISHRLTSGLSLVMVVILFFMARRVSAKQSALRSAAGWSLGFIIVEALIGAGLVLFELVAHNASLKRVFSMSAHLLNTFALLGALCLVIHRADESIQHRKFNSSDLGLLKLPIVTAILLSLTGMTGAIAALGDTLYSAFGTMPLQAYLDGEVPLLLRLRLVHPVVAIATAAFLVWYQVQVADRFREVSMTRLTWLVSGLTLLEIGLGFVNVYLMAPVWMQLVHLGVGVSLWISFMQQSFLSYSKSMIK